MTRAQSQVVAWWSPAYDEPNGGLSRLLRGRGPGESAVPDRCVPAKISDDDAMARLRKWEAAGGPVIEESVVAPSRSGCPPSRAERLRSPALPPRDRHRVAAHVVLGADPGRRDDAGSAASRRSSSWTTRSARFPLVQRSTGPDVPSPMADLPKGAKFGTLVHAVLETADPFAADLAAELETQIRRALGVVAGGRAEPPSWQPRWCRCTTRRLGPLADGLTLRQIGLRDRLREMDFEFPLAGGDLRATAPDIQLRDVGRAAARAPACRRPAGVATPSG